jgi:hypothetical protein
MCIKCEEMTREPGWLARNRATITFGMIVWATITFGMIVWVIIPVVFIIVALVSSL